MKEYEVWMEGYRATGESAPHRFIGKAEAETFKDACYIAVKNWCSSEEDFKKYYNSENQSFWGCRCFDNERDSMRFG